MVLENNEYIVSKAGVPDQSITILKSALEKWRDHYNEVSKEFANKALDDNSPSATYDFKFGFYSGKRDVLIDLLKMFEELEG